MQTPIPAALDEAFDQWDAAGRPAASGSRWIPHKWEEFGIAVPEGLSTEPITREIVATFAANVTADDRDAQRDAFVVAMIWGFGDSRYGPFRVDRIMGEPDFPEHLHELTVAILEGGGIEAYRVASGRRRSQDGFVKWLGTAFGTKYLYFVSLGRGSRVGPILDDVVRRWLKAHAPEVNVRVGQWGHADRYEAYADVLSGWGEQLGIAAGDVEYLIFAQQQSRNGNRAWSEPWVGGRETSAEERLAQLRQALEARGLAEQAAGALDGIEQILGGDAARDGGSLLE